MIASIQTEEDFKEHFDFELTSKTLNFINEVDIEKRARFFSISQLSKTKYMIRFKSYPFPGCPDYDLTIEAIYSESQWRISLLNKYED